MKRPIRNVVLGLMVLAMAMMTGCQLSAPADTASAVDVVLDGFGAEDGARAITGDANVAWVRINVKTSGGTQAGAKDLSKTGDVWRGKVSVTGTGNMTFIATAGTQDGTTGVYHVSYAGSAVLDVTGAGLSLTIPVIAGDSSRHVFYINSNSATDGWRYLEAASSDQSTGIAWITGGDTQITLNDNTLLNIGRGKDNTDYMAAQPGYTGGAAKVCKDHAGSGFTDWFLPSKNELNEMYLKKATIGNFNLGVLYWSSSESDTIAAYSQDFSDGTQYDNFPKTYDNNVRAIRAF